MSKFKGTPGPWEVIIGGNFLQVWEQGRYSNMKYLSRSFGKIAEIALSGTGNNPDGEEDIANARLIAAAPTMREYIAKRAAAGDSEARSLLEAVDGDA